METTLTPQSLGQKGFTSDLRAFSAILRREWTIFTRYPSWIIALVIWPLIFPMLYILTARALSGPDGGGLAVFTATTGATDYIGYIIVGTTVWMWQNIVLWDVGFSLRNEQMRGTLESNWLSPTWRFSYLLGHSAPQIVSMIMFIAITALEFGSDVWRPLERQRMDACADDARRHPRHLRIGFCLCKPCHHRQRGQRICIPHPRHGDDLLRHYLSRCHPA